MAFRDVQSDCRHGARNVQGIGNEVYFIAWVQLVLVTRNKRPAIPNDANDLDIQVGEKSGKLAERRIDDRALLAEPHPDKADRIVGQFDHFNGARRMQAAHNCPCDFLLG